jgi:drug/metabolite transporter (DMT)-like permease
MPNKRPFGVFRWLGLIFFLLAICALVLGVRGEGGIVTKGVVINENAWSWLCIAGTLMGGACFFAGDRHDKNRKKYLPKG